MVNKKASKAASLLGKRSVQARIERWGEEEYLRRQREYGKLGGRPRGSSKKGSKHNG